jgi:hypothetical protein
MRGGGIKTNRELRASHKIPDLVADIKSRIFEWLGHVVGMGQTRLITDIFENQTLQLEVL